MHLTFALLGARPLLSILCHTYQFIQRRYRVTCRLWESAADEIASVCDLLDLAFSDFRRPWSDEVLCSDSSLSGFGLVSKVFDRASVAKEGAYDERWRFKRRFRAGEGPRGAALRALDPFTSLDTVLPMQRSGSDDVEVDSRFPEVASQLVEEDGWREVLAGPWRRRQPVRGDGDWAKR